MRHYIRRMNANSVNHFLLLPISSTSDDLPKLPIDLTNLPRLVGFRYLKPLGIGRGFVLALRTRRTSAASATPSASAVTQAYAVL
eukprot:6197661-Pleurochrysis_carterae.AAC.2